LFKKTISFFVVSLFAAGLMIGCGAASSRPSPFKSDELQFTSPQNGDTIAIFDTSMGTFRAILFPALAPLAVENFVTLAKQGYYDGILFHRVVKDFVIQGGDPTATGGGGESIWGNPFADEFTDSLHNYTGALSMANSGENTNTSQFFIVDAPADSVSAALAGQMKTGGYRQEVIDAYRAVGGAPYLDGKHTVFGQIYSGMDVIDKIASVAVDEKTDRPKKDIVIESISIDTYQQDTSSSN
jgi:peptidyl-prolyl cis-trans isomerase B (cyclophilin B)